MKKTTKKIAVKKAVKKTTNKVTKKTKKETVAQEALRLLSKVPATKWTVDNYTDDVGKCCALGHLSRLKSKKPKDFSYANCAVESTEFPIRKLTREFLVKKYRTVSDIVDVNDKETVNGYNQSNPKARVIACLKDMVKEGF